MTDAACAGAGLSQSQLSQRFSFALCKQCGTEAGCSEEIGEVVWCCFVIVIFIMRRAGDRVLLGWLGRAGAGDSFYYSSSQPPALLLSTPCPCHLVTGHLEPHYLGYSYTRCKHFSVSELPFPVWTRETMPMHRNVECECALESFDRKDGTSTFPIIWKLFRILNFDIIFNSSGIKQVGHIEYDKICKIASIPYYI